MSIIDVSLNTLEEIVRDLKQGNNTYECIEHDLNIAKSLIQSIKIELHTITNKEYKEKCVERLRFYNQSISKYQQNTLREHTTNIKHQSLNRLQQARDQLVETEELGIDVLSNIVNQKIQIQQVKNKLDQTNQDLNRSNKLLHRMSTWWKN